MPDDFKRGHLQAQADIKNGGACYPGLGHSALYRDGYSTAVYEHGEAKRSKSLFVSDLDAEYELEVDR